jgi:hypothetical protein
VDRNGETVVPELPEGHAVNMRRAVLESLKYSYHQHYMDGRGRLRALVAFAPGKVVPVLTGQGSCTDPKRTVTCPAGNQPSVSRLSGPKAIDRTA